MKKRSGHFSMFTMKSQKKFLYRHLSHPCYFSFTVQNHVTGSLYFRSAILAIRKV